MVKNYSQMLDRIYRLDANGFIIDVRVLDIKQSYGTARAQVTPLHGEGIHWVLVDRLEGEGRLSK